ncbi:MAG: carbohydrate-binding protein [Bacteroidales bacterium]
MKGRHIKSWSMLLTGLLILVSQLAWGQGYLHADGKRMVNGAGENVILRGIGTGNWMLQEGYMMLTSGVAGTQHEFRAKLIQSIGEANTDSFYTVWLENHFTRTDVDSMASWGFNSVRVAMHYKWFTLPIEEEPVPGEQTWLDKGFEMIDSLLDWCGDNQIYLILDMHGAPGGQGKNADISDYDPGKPSLWESQENKDKFVALWQRLAARYSDEPWIGGYDLINETNWSFPGGNNSQMRALYTRTTDSIRTVDPNHMIIIEGNSFANDFSGLTPPWDDNMAYSFHHYWTYNTPGSLKWVTDLRNSHNVPIWMGEAGENSNTWFTDLVALCEQLNIGWSWWPVKKTGINNVLSAEVNEDYLQLIENWKGNGPFLSGEEAFRAVLTFAENHRIENCTYHKDVIDALIRQPHTTQTLPFRIRTTADTIFASDYDLGRNGYAYFDNDTADYHGETGDFTAWNQGWAYRSDGVDIEECNDPLLTNGYNVGWTEAGEWLGYTLQNDSSAAWSMEIRSASAGSGTRIQVVVNGSIATGEVALPYTGGTGSWRTTTIDNIILPEGKVELRLLFVNGGSNLNYFRLFNPVDADSVPFTYLSSATAILENQVMISLNKEVTSAESLSIADFQVNQGGIVLDIDQVRVNEANSHELMITTSSPLFYGKTIRISYTGSSVRHHDQVLPVFELEKVHNRMARHFPLPARIQAEYFYENNGLVLEECSEGGSNTGYADVGDYLDYILYVEEEGDYEMDFRIATERSGARLSVQADYGDGFQALKSVSFAGTGGWQNWTTQGTTVRLEAGKFILRLLVTGAEHNLNWFEFKKIVGVNPRETGQSFSLYPNPSTGAVTLDVEGSSFPVHVDIVNLQGRVVFRDLVREPVHPLDLSNLPSGLYFVRLGEAGSQGIRKLIVN